MMPASHILITLALLATTGYANAARQGMPAGGDQPYSGLEGPGGLTPENISERLQRAVEHLSQLQSKFGPASAPEAAASFDGAQNLIAQVRQALAAGNTMLAASLCDQLEKRISEFNYIGQHQAMERVKSGQGPGGPGFDTSRLRQDQQIGADFDIQRTAERLAYFSQRLETGKNPQAADLLEKIRNLIDAARKENAAGRPLNVRPLLAQAESLLPELQRLIQDNVNSDKQNLSGTGPGSFKVQQPVAQPALGQAWEHYRRVFNNAARLGERPAGPEDARSAALRARVNDLLEKAKDALEKAQAEAAKEYCIKAESQLAEWHRSMATADNKLSPASWDRLKTKMERAGDIVAAAGNEKASRILEKGREHFERAERSHSEGQAARAEVEMDLALKLAAKAVDIARSGRR